MRAPLALLLCSVAAGCTINSGVETTPTFQAARYLPPTTPAKTYKPGFDALHQAEPGPAMTSHPGAQTVMAANRSATVEPTDSTMQGASWIIDNHDQSKIYKVPVQLKRVTTLLLPAGEKFNGAMGGDVEGYLINVAYAGPRPAVSILPREAAARGNLQLATTGGLYSFDLVTNRSTSVNLVDIGRPQDVDSGSHGQVEASPQPQGDFTRLSFKTPDGKALPAWAPTEAWADSTKMVVRFQGPLPVLPALFAGQKGEQIVAYRTVVDNGSPSMVTNRRITEGELRLDQEVVTLTADSIEPVDPNPHGWRQAGDMPEVQLSKQAVNVFVLPAGMGEEGGVMTADTPFVTEQPRQPMMNHPLVPPSEPGV